MILTTSQAQAFFNAMAELNNVGATLKASFGENNDGNWTIVFENEDGIHVRVVEDFSLTEKEEYASQSEFAQAYGVQ